jgi:SAM-dependent methyltransferase
MSEIFGYNALEVGILSGKQSLLKHSRIATSFSIIEQSELWGYQNNLKTEEVNEPLALVSTTEQLPVATDNIDLVIASHVLESSEDPHQALREIDRVLVPEGHCILIGFNPFVLSGLGYQFRSLIRRDKSPFKTRSVSRVRDWFSVLGYEVLDVQYMGFRPRVKNKKLFSKLSWMEKIGEYTGPLLGKLYVIHVKKQVVAMSSHKKVWRAPALLSGGKVVLNNTAQKIRRENYSNY